MSKVLASLKPYYYYLVGEGIKEIEVRKGEPKSKTWDRDVLFYMSKDEKSFAKIPKELQEKYRKHFGKVGLEFICDEIKTITMPTNLPQDFLEKACLSGNDIMKYLGGDFYKTFYGWHISDLKIHDKPKELSEFQTQRKCNGCKVSGYESSACPFDEECIVIRDLTHPPQSWCYVENKI